MSRAARPKSLVGVVTSNKMQKTITVEVVRQVLHPKYHKYLRRRSRFKAHDEKNAAQIGDTVRIVPTRPLSKEKSFRLIEIVSQGHKTT
jgi:small subunit ribosomal protein S17